LLIPLAAAIVAALWGRWAARHRATGDGASLAGYERFRTAMESAGANVEAAPAGSREPASETPDQADQAAEPAPVSAPGPVPETLRSRIPHKPLSRGPDRPAPAGDEGSPRGPVAGPVP
jgi:hypothetical protein